MKILIVMALWIPGFAVASERTDFNEAGDQYVLDRYLVYESAPKVCASPRMDRRRVILTGFGPFMGPAKNISSEALYVFGQFHAPAPPNDVSGNTREVSIGGEAVQICFLSVATTWDLASAIIISEAESFVPDFIFMTGVGGGTFVFETTSVNEASWLNGYDISGKALADNTPIASYVLPPADKDVLPEEPMTWDAQKVWSASSSMISELGYDSQVESVLTSPDNYICNNTRYAVAHAARGLPVELAGGKLKLTPKIPSQPTVGFLHYSGGLHSDETSLSEWSEVLKKIIETALF